LIEGPFARNNYYKQMLEAVTGEFILSSASATGTSIGAAMLLQRQPLQMFDSQPKRENTPMRDALKTYATRWRSHVEGENKV
jgi:sugar (pentulose or hexulose) kinase